MRNEASQDREVGRFKGFRRPWTHFDLANADVFKDVERKARDVEEGTDYFDRDEIHKVLAFMVRSG